MHHNPSSEETVRMDATSDMLHCNYPLIDPHWSSFNLLAEVATDLYFQVRSSIPCIKKEYHLKPKKTVKNSANQALKKYGFTREEATNKPINFTDSVFELGTSSSLKIHQHPKKTMKNYANQVFKEKSSLEEEASKKAKKPINYGFPREEATNKPNNFMGFVVESGASSSLNNQLHPEKTKKNYVNQVFKEEEASKKGKKPVNYGFPTEEATNKPNNFMGSVVELGASSSLKIQLHPKKTMKNYANQVFKEYSSLEEEASKKGKKPINYMDSATETCISRNEDVINNIYNFKKDDHALKIKKRNGLKRTHGIFINDEENIDVIDDLDQELVLSESSKKKQKNSKRCSNNKRQKAKQLSEDTTDTTTLPDLPPEFKNKINEMGGNQITLVIEKSLYQTDLSPQHNRLSMPLKQIKNASFLREEELQVLGGKQGIEVPMLQPSFELENVTLAKWDMPKSPGSTNSSYVLRSSWMKVAAANQLEQNDVVQIWSFRVQEELYMALVKV